MGILIKNRLFRIAAVLLAISILSASSPAKAEVSETIHLYEQKIKAGLVYNFLKFTGWPPDSAMKKSRKMKVCLYGGDSFDGFLYPLEGKTAQQYVIVVSVVMDVNETDSCSVLFVNGSRQSELDEILQHLAGKPVLTMSDIYNFSEKGGMVEMTREDEHIGLRINKESAVAAGLRIQDRVLRLGKLVSHKG